MIRFFNIYKRTGTRIHDFLKQYDEIYIRIIPTDRSTGCWMRNKHVQKCAVVATGIDRFCDV